MKRSLIASTLFAGLAALCAPASQATPGPSQNNVILKGAFSTAVDFSANSAELYGVPVVGSVCLKKVTDPETGELVCTEQKSGLLYSPVQKTGSGALSYSGSIPYTNRLDIGGTMISFLGDDFLYWHAILGFNPYYQTVNKGSVLSFWYLVYNNLKWGTFQIGNSLALDAFTSLNQDYSLFGNVVAGITPNQLYNYSPTLTGAPFSYQAPGISYQSPYWNNLAFSFSFGGSVKQHKGVKDTQWQNDLSSSIGVKHTLGAGDPTLDTPQRAIQWAVGFEGYFRGLKDFPTPFKGQWMFSYAQSKQLNAPNVSVLDMRRAAHVSFANAFFRHFFNVVEFTWSQNALVSFGQSFTAQALQDLGLQSNFDAMLITPNFVNPGDALFDHIQYVKPIPFWNIAASFTLFHWVMNLSDLAVTAGYTRTETNGYDYPGFALNKNGTNSWGRYWIFRGTNYGNRLESVFDYGIPTLQTTSFDPVKPYAPETKFQYGKLKVQSYYLDLRYRFMSPYDQWFNSMVFTVGAELVYSKVGLELQGTPDQLAQHYPTKSFDLGKDLYAHLILGFEYHF